MKPITVKLRLKWFAWLSLIVLVVWSWPYLFEREPETPWSEVLLTLPRRIALPPVFGREAVALTPNGRTFYISTERDKNDAAAIFLIQLDERQG